MIRTYHNRLRISLTPGFCFFLALLILSVPLRWLLAAAISVAMHEMCHIAAIRCFGNKIYSLQVGIGGARIHTQPMTPFRELICALAGPAGGAVLLLLVRWFPMVAICAGIHTFYNLLPVHPQDGGRALRCGARLLLPDRWANWVCNIVEYVCLAGVGFLGVYGTFILKVGIFPVAFAILFLQRSSRMKNTLQSV